MDARLAHPYLRPVACGEHRCLSVTLRTWNLELGTLRFVHLLLWRCRYAQHETHEFLILPVPIHNRGEACFQHTFLALHRHMGVHLGQHAWHLVGNELVFLDVARHHVNKFWVVYLNSVNRVVIVCSQHLSVRKKRQHRVNPDFLSRQVKENLLCIRRECQHRQNHTCYKSSHYTFLSRFPPLGRDKGWVLTLH